MKLKTLTVIFLLNIFATTCWSHETNDSIQTKELEELTVQGQRLLNLERLPPVEGTRIWSGKKNDIINLQELNANIAEKTPRQAFAKTWVCLFMTWMVQETKSIYQRVG